MKKGKLIFEMPDFTVISEVTDKTLDKCGFAIAELAKLDAPVKSGEYKANIYYYPEIKEVIAEARHSAALEYGVKERIIKAKKGTYLKFKINGKDIFVKEVHQKARKPNPIMRNAAREGQKALGGEFINNLKRRLTRVRKGNT